VIVTKTLDASASLVTGLRAGIMGFDSREGQAFFCWPSRPDPPLPTQPPSQRVMGTLSPVSEASGT
jgi:hypothetical protein